MKKVIYYMQLYSVLLLFWIALFERFDAFIISIGLAFIISTIFYVEKFLFKKSFFDTIDVNIPKLAIYFIVLLYEIFVCSLKTIPQIISMHTNPDIVDITTNIKSISKQCILANSITLTPGTVTIDLHENTLKVLWLDSQTKNSVLAGILIKGTLERYLQ